MSAEPIAAMSTEGPLVAIHRCPFHHVPLREIEPTDKYPAGLECPEGHKIVSAWEVYNPATKQSLYTSWRHGLLDDDGRPAR